MAAPHNQKGLIAGGWSFCAQMAILGISEICSFKRSKPQQITVFKKINFSLSIAVSVQLQRLYENDFGEHGFTHVCQSYSENYDSLNAPGI